MEQQSQLSSNFFEQHLQPDECVFALPHFPSVALGTTELSSQTSSGAQPSALSAESLPNRDQSDRDRACSLSLSSQQEEALVSLKQSLQLLRAAFGRTSDAVARVVFAPPSELAASQIIYQDCQLSVHL